MKIVKFSGGLGNQMYQYAFGVALKHFGNEVLYDVNWFEKINSTQKQGATKRNFDLELFNINKDYASQEQIEKCKKEKLFGIKWPSFMRKCYSHIIKEKNALDYYEYFLHIPYDAYYAGVFANEKYFSAYRDELVSAFQLQKELTPENKKMLQQIQNTNSVSLHIRRGDYVKLGLVCNLEYYENAIQEILSHEKNAHFYIFSDDIDWVKANLSLPEAHTYVSINDGKHGYYDFELMKNCHHNIIANSTFSWWASWLNTYQDKRVLAPLDKQSSEFCYLFK